MIVTSSLDELDSVVRCLEMGAEDYLTRPVKPCCQCANQREPREERLRDEERELIGKFATKESGGGTADVGARMGGRRRRLGHVMSVVHDDRGSPQPRGRG